MSCLKKYREERSKCLEEAKSKRHRLRRKREREREARSRESDPKIGSNEHNLNRSSFEGSIDRIECAERTKWR